ncbi:MAG: glycosyltransferase family 4 protein [Ignavibacteria bacterium]|nr:glycosyltransferase family 4 protein [Ignavibacteria bacterium]
MSQYKKILLISSEFPPGPGGIGNHAYNLAKSLKQNEIEVKVLTVSDYVDKTTEENFDRKINFNIVRFKRYKSRLKTYRKRIKLIFQTLKKEKFTHTIFSGRFSLLSSLLLKSYTGKIKFIAIGHGSELVSGNTAEKILIDRALMKMDLVIPVSNFSKSKLSKSLSEKKIVVIPNGFDLDNIDELEIKEKCIEKGALNLVTIGTISPRKGQHNVLNALPVIIEKFPEVKYNIVGRSADLSKFKNITEEKKLQSHIKIHGSLSNDEMYKVLNESHIFLMLSESQSDGDFEGFGIAVIEANYFGLPAIGSKNSGIEDAINNGVSGIKR